jgi:hypothetical protein
MKIQYRCPIEEENPEPGHILMGNGPRVRRAYRVLGVRQSRGGRVALGCSTWVLTVESLSAETGRREILAGHPHWGIKWDARKKGARRLETVNG